MDYDCNIVWSSPPEDEGDEYEARMRANSLINYARGLEEEQMDVHTLNLWHYQMYSNRFLSSFDWGTGTFTKASLQPVNRTTDNVVLQIVDALLAEIGKQRPKAKPVLFGASWKDNRSARKLDKFLYGEFIRNSIYEECKNALLNAFICGFGCVRADVEDSDVAGARICVKNVFSDDVIVDNLEYSSTGKVYTVLYRRVLPIDTVKATYGISDEEAKFASQDIDYSNYRNVGKGWIVVVEGHRAASVDYQGNVIPGRHMVVIKDKIIVDEEWKHPWLPYVFFHWSRPTKTFYTSGVVEQALPNQVRLNEINDVIRKSQDLVSKPRLLVQQGSRVNPLEINNLIGKLVMYTGTEPKPLIWPAVNPEIYNEREREIKSAFDKFGLNSSTISGQLPPQARLDSSAAVREYNTIQDSRLSDVVQRYENFFLDIAKLMVRMIGTSGKNPKTVWYSGGRKSRAEVIKWKDINLDDNAYTLILEAASSFSMTPSAIRDSLEDQLLKGLITTEQYKRELGSPDLDTSNACSSAGLEDIYRVGELLEEGEYESPIPEQDLINGTKLIQLKLLELNNYEESKELLQIKLNFINWLNEARMWMKKASETPPSPPTPPGGTMPPQPMNPPLPVPGM